MASIMVTGSRDWVSDSTIRQALFNAFVELGADNETVLISGGCPSGADHIAEKIWVEEMGLVSHRFPALWQEHGKAAGPIRNQQMVNASPNIVLAFPMGESKGTRGTIRMAEKAGLDVRIFEGISVR